MKGRHIGEFEELVMLAVRCGVGPVGSVDVQEILQREASRRASLGAIYAAMERLERKALVHSRLVEPVPGQGGRQRRCYELTPAGCDELRSVRRVRERLWGEAPARAGAAERDS